LGTGPVSALGRLTGELQVVEKTKETGKRGGRWLNKIISRELGGLHAARNG